MSDHLPPVSREFYLADENASETLGAAVAEAILENGSDTRSANGNREPKPIVIYFSGELGAGKTTMIRSLLRRFGHQGTVKSPTYTLVEPYVLETNGGREIYHLDLYRLADPEELEMLGLRDFLTCNALILVEWPERGLAYLPPATLVIRLEYEKTGRRCVIESASAQGQRLMGQIRQP